MEHTPVELALRRVYDNSDTTLGYMLDLTEKLFLGFTCEDQKQIGPKLKGETRIPAGRYRITLNKSLTPKTEEYRKNYAWFVWHMMLNDVHGFTGIYIHIGNSDEDTDGCLLLGDNATNIAVYKTGRSITESKNAFERFYKKYYPLLDSDVPIYITVIDEQF